MGRLIPARHGMVLTSHLCTAGHLFASEPRKLRAIKYHRLSRQQHLWRCSRLRPPSTNLRSTHEILQAGRSLGFQSRLPVHCHIRRYPRIGRTLPGALPPHVSSTMIAGGSTSPTSRKTATPSSPGSAERWISPRTTWCGAWAPGDQLGKRHGVHPDGCVQSLRPRRRRQGIQDR